MAFGSGLLWGGDWMRKQRGRLTGPLVRENGKLRPASWDEALGVAAAGLARARPQDATRFVWDVQLFEGVERGQLLGSEVRPFRDGVE